MDRKLLEEAVDQRIGESDRLILRLCKRYLRGIMTDSETRLSLAEDAVLAFRDVLGPFGLSYSLSLENQQRFLDEHDGWKKGRIPENTGGAEWLFYRPRDDTSLTDPSEKADARRVSAPLFAREQFFRMAGEYRIPVEYFLPLPADIPDPCAYSTHTYGNGEDYRVIFECAGPDDFFTDPDPTGKEYILTGRYGQKAAVTVRHVYTEGEKVPFRNYFLEKRAGVMAAEGILEGYMKEEPHSFEMEKCGSRSVCFSLKLTNEDVGAFYRYPLWKPYFAWAVGKHNLLADSRFACFEAVYQKEYEAWLKAKNGT